MKLNSQERNETLRQSKMIDFLLLKESSDNIKDEKIRALYKNEKYNLLKEMMEYSKKSNRLYTGVMYPLSEKIISESQVKEQDKMNRNLAAELLNENSDIHKKIYSSVLTENQTPEQINKNVGYQINKIKLTNLISEMEDELLTKNDDFYNQYYQHIFSKRTDNLARYANALTYKMLNIDLSDTYSPQNDNVKTVEDATRASIRYTTDPQKQNDQNPLYIPGDIDPESRNLLNPSSSKYDETDVEEDLEREKALEDFSN